MLQQHPGTLQLWLGRGLEKETLAPSPSEKSIPEPQAGLTAPAVPSGPSPAICPSPLG